MVQPRSVACDRGGKTVPRIRDERCSPKPSALIRIGAANSPSQITTVKLPQIWRTQRLQSQDWEEAHAIRKPTEGAR
jgi:hypothetical protein